MTKKNKTIGFAVLLTGIFFLACGVLHQCLPPIMPFDPDTVLFLGADVPLLVAGGLLRGGVALAPRGSLMAQHDQRPKH